MIAGMAASHHLLLKRPDMHQGFLLPSYARKLHGIGSLVL